MSMSRENGLSLLGFLFVLLVVGVCLTVLFRLGPLYLDNYTVAQSFASLGDDDVRSLSDQRSAEKILVSLDYERRVPLLGNVDAVVRFHNVYDSSRD
jgi:hypothetical protein